jgi:hypothetical protein
MTRSNQRQSALLLLITASLSSCSSNVIISTPAATQVTVFGDPFAYCEAVGTIDAPDARYTGAAMPEVIVKGLMKAFNAPPDAPLEFFARGSFWRCMGGKVYACSVGANIPCESKADTRTTPNEGMTNWCSANPDTDGIPAAAAGRETVYEWNCKGGQPQIVRQVLSPDARGFISAFWYVISPS